MARYAEPLTAKAPRHITPDGAGAEQPKDAAEYQTLIC